MEWIENTLQEAEEQLFSTSSLQTPTPQEKTSKRQREEGSSSTTGSEAKEFRISYIKREKLTPRIDVEKETKEHDAIIITDSSPISNKFVTSSSRPSSSQG